MSQKSLGKSIRTSELYSVFQHIYLYANYTRYLSIAYLTLFLTEYPVGSIYVLKNLNFYRHRFILLHINIKDL